MPVCEAGEGFGQPFVGVDGIEFAAFDECCDDGPVIAAFIRSGEQRVFAAQCQRSDAAFDGVGCCQRDRRTGVGLLAGEDEQS